MDIQKTQQTRGAQEDEQPILAHGIEELSDCHLAFVGGGCADIVFK